MLLFCYAPPSFQNCIGLGTAQDPLCIKQERFLMSVVWRKKNVADQSGDYERAKAWIRSQYRKKQKLIK